MSEPTPPDPRVVLAAERTLLAWMRTGLSLMGFGFVVAKFGWFLRAMPAIGEVVPEIGATASLRLGTLFVGLGVWVLIGSTIRYQRFLRNLNRGDHSTPGPGLGTAVAWVLAAVGVGMVAYLVALALQS